MSTVGVTEFDAAQALLDLQSNGRESISNGESKEAAETAKLFLSCLLASNMQSTPKKVAVTPKIGTVNPTFYVVPKTINKSYQESSTSNALQQVSTKRELPDHVIPTAPGNEVQTNKRSKIFKRKPIRHYPVTSSPIHLPCITIENIKSRKVTDKQTKTVANKAINAVIKPKTRDFGTQTDEKYEMPEIETMEYTISKLCEKIKSLEAQIQSNSQIIETINQDNSENDDLDDDDDESYKPNSNDMTYDDSFDLEDTLTDSERENKVKKNKARPLGSGVKSSKVLSNRNTNGDDMVPIGFGNAMIPARIYRHINWNSYTSATRKLLTAVFSRRVLATHSLTGKPSPAFPLKPPKKRLDAVLVNDIVQTVVEQCGVPENVVRTSITTKCADESKMFRTREQNKRKRKHRVDNENIPPSFDSE